MFDYSEVKSVTPQSNYTLLITFENGERGVFDVKPYLHKGVFKKLQDFSLFQTAHPCFGSVAWANDIDIAPERIFDEAVRI